MLKRSSLAGQRRLRRHGWTPEPPRSPSSSAATITAPRSSAIRRTRFEKFSEEAGYGKDLTVEDVQHIKELVAKVGRLEFRILANAHDDKEAIAFSEQMLNVQKDNDAKLAQEIKDAQAKGLPPPGPRANRTTAAPRNSTRSAWPQGLQKRGDLQLGRAGPNRAPRVQPRQCRQDRCTTRATP